MSYQDTWFNITGKMTSFEFKNLKKKLEDIDACNYKIDLDNNELSLCATDAVTSSMCEECLNAVAETLKESGSPSALKYSWTDSSAEASESSSFGVITRDGVESIDIDEAVELLRQKKEGVAENAEGKLTAAAGSINADAENVLLATGFERPFLFPAAPEAKFAVLRLGGDGAWEVAEFSGSRSFDGLAMLASGYEEYFSVSRFDSLDDAVKNFVEKIGCGTEEAPCPR